MANRKKVLNIGVLLDNNKRFREALGHDESLDLIIEPKDVNQMLRYFQKLAKEGKQIQRLILMGHGSKSGHHIGLLRPEDVDRKIIRGLREERYKVKGELAGEIGQAKKALAAASSDGEKQKLRTKLDGLEQRLRTVSAGYEDGTLKEQAFADIEDLMAPDATVGLLNCEAAATSAGKQFMRDLADILVSKHGGTVIGNEDKIQVKKISPVLAWITGKPDYLAKPLGNWVVIDKSATGKSRRKCGAACKDFERYGFCDRPAAKNGGPCYQHR